MAETKKSRDYSGASHHYWALALGSVAYAYFTFTSPITNNKYQLSSLHTHLLQLTLVVPAVLILWAAFYGAIRFKAYSLKIKESTEGKALDFVSNGLLILSYGLLIQSVLGTLRQHFLSVGGLNGFTIINNYTGIIFPLIAFVIMLMGAARLLQSSKFRAAYIKIAIVIIGIASMATIYTFGVFHNPYRNMTPDANTYQSYYLSDGKILMSIIIPNIAVWAFGVLTVLSLQSYSQNTKGFIYKESLHKLVQGLSIVVSLSIGINLLSTIGPSLTNLRLGALLGFVYVLVAAYALGYLMIAKGAQKLYLIEEL